MQSNKNYYDSFSSFLWSIKEHRLALAVVLLLHLTAMLLELAIPFITQALVDQGINNQDYSFIFYVLMGLLMLTCSKILVGAFKHWMLRNTGVRIAKGLLVAFFQRILKKNIGFFYTNTGGKLIELITGSIRIERFFTDSLNFLIETLLKTIIYSFILFYFDPKICFIFLGSLVIGIAWDMLFVNKRELLDQMRFRVSSKLRGEIIETVQSIFDIKANGQEENRKSRWDRIQNLLAMAQIKLMVILQQNQATYQVITQVRDIFIIYIAAISVVEGSLTLGGLLAVQYIIGQLNRTTNSLATFIAEYQEAQLSFERIRKVMDEPMEEKDRDEGLKTIPKNASLAFQNINFDYGTTPCLKNVSFELPFGGNIAIVGESGSGKSTMVKLMLKFLEPKNGDILLGAKKLNLISSRAWREQCSVVFQESMLVNDSFKFNITFTTNESEVDVEWLDQVIDMCELREVVNKLDNGVETIIGSGGTVMSRGQSQRVMLARAIYKNASYVILDEPTSALDAMTAFTVFQNIKKHNKDRTMLIITHKINIARQMDLIYVVEDGKIVERGKHDELMKLEGKYHQLATIK